MKRKNNAEQLFNAVSEAALKNDSISYEIGKSLILQALESGRDYCKIMLPIAISSIGVYFALLSWIWPKSADAMKPLLLGTWAESGLTILPSFFFLLAAVSYSLGVFAAIPVEHEPPASIMQQAEE